MIRAVPSYGSLTPGGPIISDYPKGGVQLNIYENIVILNASLTDEDIETAAGKIKDLITTAKGEILKTDNWGRKKLAYEIKKQKRGLYILFLFKAPAPLIKKLEDYYKVSDNVIKHMIIKFDKKQSAHALTALSLAEAAAKAEAAAAVAAAEQKPAEPQIEETSV